MRGSWDPGEAGKCSILVRIRRIMFAQVRSIFYCQLAGLSIKEQTRLKNRVGEQIKDIKKKPMVQRNWLSFHISDRPMGESR